ncbi:MAG: right-handed parallel beta-helix repeat-containing protein [Planctomycetota bacterium]|nr:MAG: right-handed parallel beta-helix repeat-containing protein [Planctomycetota bacterium]
MRITAYLLIACSFLLATNPSGAQVFVSPDGDDGGPGNFQRPFRTPERAKQEVRMLRQQAPLHDVVVLFREGDYLLSSPLVITAEDGGDEKVAVLWSAYGKETVRFLGGRKLNSIRSQDSPIWQGNIAAEVSDLRGLYAGDLRLPRAHFPDHGWLRVKKAGPDRRTAFQMPVEGVKTLSEFSGLEVLLLHDWSTSRIPVAEIDLETGWLRTQYPIGCKAPHYAIDNFEAHPRFRLEGHPSLLTAPGEWHFQPSSRLVSFIPPKTEEETLEYSVLTSLVKVEGKPGAPVRNFHFQGIQFELCAFSPPQQGWAGAQASMHERRDGSENSSQRIFVPAALDWRFALDCSLDSCVMKKLDGSALWIGPGCRNLIVRNCIIQNVGANGLNIGEDGSRSVDGKPWWRSAGDDQEWLTQNIVVENCLIEDCGRLYGGAVGLWIGFAQHCQIRNNEIRNLPYTGLSVGWVWATDPSPCREHRIERNHIHDVMQLLSDGGCIYTLGRQPGTIIRQNHLHGVPRHAGRAPSNGIFMDEGTTEIAVEGNWIHGIGHSPIRFHRAKENTVRDNQLEVPDGLPPFYYNRTEAKWIERVGNALNQEMDPKRCAEIARLAGRNPPS